MTDGTSLVFVSVGRHGHGVIVVAAGGDCFGSSADDLLSHFRQVFEFKLEYYSYVYPTYRASHMNLGWRGTHHFPPNRNRHTEYVIVLDTSRHGNYY